MDQPLLVHDRVKLKADRLGRSAAIHEVHAGGYVTLVWDDGGYRSCHSSEVQKLTIFDFREKIMAAWRSLPPEQRCATRDVEAHAQRFVREIAHDLPGTELDRYEIVLAWLAARAK